MTLARRLATGDTYAVFVTSRMRTETRASSASVYAGDLQHGVHGMQPWGKVSLFTKWGRKATPSGQNSVVVPNMRMFWIADQADLDNGIQHFVKYTHSCSVQFCLIPAG